MSATVRTCVGCGRRAPQSTLVRYAVVDGRLVPGRTLPGRGAYTCRSRACFERARSRRAFARALHTAVAVGQPPDLLDDRNYTESLDG